MARAGKEMELAFISKLGVDSRQAAGFEASSNGCVQKNIDEKEVGQEEIIEGKLVGDVEFHIWASDWFTHGHQDDPRYNRVVLHVVYYLDGKMPARRQDGVPVLACSLRDLPRPPRLSISWSCQQRPLAAHELTTTLLCSGLLRFTEKSAALEHALRALHTLCAR